ncbi:MAG: hypothetical protein ACRDK8_08780, partial [Solirubrobacteraceae bacterium]
MQQTQRVLVAATAGGEGSPGLIEAVLPTRQRRALARLDVLDEQQPSALNEYAAGLLQRGGGIG